MPGKSRRRASGVASTPSVVLRLKAPAKINWILQVRGRRADGYHEIDSIMQAVSLYDVLELRPLDKLVCRIRCEYRTDLSDRAGRAAPNGAGIANFSEIPTDEENLIHHAWRSLREAYPDRVGGIDVHLTKTIPSGAGLGGGSSDAAATLMGLKRLYRLPLTLDRLSEIAAAIGSDVPFFIRGGLTHAQGRGELLTALPCALAPMPIVIARPGFSSPTAGAYARLSPRFFRTSRRCDHAARAAQFGDAASLTALSFNVFDRLLTPGDRRYSELKAAMTERGLARAMLCGSGSACFAVADSFARARRAAASLRKQRVWAFASRTLRSGVRPA